jgi:pescadillo
MLTFLEFYQTFASFINYRLYTSTNLVYPPKLDIDKDDAGAGLAAYLLQSATEQPTLPAPITNTKLPIKDTTKQVETLPSKLATLSTPDDAINDTPDPSPADDENLDTFTSADPANELQQPTPSTQQITNSLFSGLHVYISRETPVDALLFLLLSFSVSSLSMDAISGPHPYDETDGRITHQICDRGKLPERIVPGRKYVQPQWVVDSINRGILLDESEYIPGAELPPHLSPFVDKKAGLYDPEADVEVESEEEESEVEEIDEEKEEQRLLEAEAAGDKTVQVLSKKKKKGRKTTVDEETEAREMAKTMMSNKKKRLLDAMEYGNRKRKAEAEKLQSRKKGLIREERKKKKAKLS